MSTKKRKPKKRLTNNESFPVVYSVNFPDQILQSKCVKFVPWADLRALQEDYDALMQLHIRALKGVELKAFEPNHKGFREVEKIALFEVGEHCFAERDEYLKIHRHFVHLMRRHKNTLSADKEYTDHMVAAFGGDLITGHAKS